MTGYPYATPAPFTERIGYAYAPFGGEGFLGQWRQSRDAAGRASPAPVPLAAPDAPPETGDVIDTDALIAHLRTARARGDLGAADRAHLRFVIQRFEVSQKLFARYRMAEGRARGEGGADTPGRYLRFAALMAEGAENARHLPSLNALIKALDVLISARDRLDAEQGAQLAGLIAAERRCVDGLRARAGRKVDVPPPPPRDASAKSLPGTTFLAADTLRSRGYAQALVAHGYRLGRVIIVTSPDRARFGQADPPPPDADGIAGCFAPDLSEPLDRICARLSDHVTMVDTGTVNHDRVHAGLRQAGGDLVVFSGFGGEIVQPGTLAAGAPFLHMHAGWLPDYRGSTTIYYSLLEKGTAAVSAITLTPQIDEGRIFARQHYAAPTPGNDADYAYDAAIRADLLLATLEAYHAAGALPEGRPQEPGEGDTFYIIHPVLKHVSLLSL